MEDLKTMSSCQNDNVHKPQERFHEEREDRLPGFRFHPTDEELVSFYLKRKVENRPITLQILNEIDVYKHDPWELAEVSSSAGDKEWYFYCKREKKYKNSVRPNRVTGSGFWKATGIDKPIYANGEGERCVGLKKSLVYYRGSAGKGSKTDWMMHEFRLPTHQTSPPNPKDTTLQEAEVWTICRIFRRCRKYTPDWRDLSAKRSTTFPNTKTCSDNESITNPERYISFSNTTTHQQKQQQQQQQYHNTKAEMVEIAGPKSTAHTSPSDSSPMNPSSSWVDDQSGGHFIAAYHGNWDDLSSLVEFAIRPPLT